MSTTTAPAAVGLFRDDEYRIEGRDKVSGKMKYTADFAPPGLLWAAFTISPFAHAKILRIDTTAAKAVPGVHAVLTADDVGRGKRSGRMLYDFPVLAYDKVIFIGDRVAAVAAETREAAEEAARLVEVEYEELPAMLDPFAAGAPDAPVIHPERASYFYAGKTQPKLYHHNMQGSYLFRRGADDLDAVFARAHRVYEHRFRTPRQHAGYIEPHATVVWIDDEGVVHVYSPNKQPYALQRFLVHVTGLAPEKVVVEPSAIGGDFGGKGLTVDEFPCYYLAQATGRPIKRVSTYSDELGSSTVRHPAYITLKTAVDADGKFIAHRSDVMYDGGAYAAGKPGPNMLPGQTGYAAVGYWIPNVAVDVRCMYTNTIPAAHVRSPGDVQLFFAWEQHVDLMAKDLAIDPFELRLRNVVHDDQEGITGEHFYHSSATTIVERIRAELAAAPSSAGRAWGASLVCRHTGGGKTSVDATLNADETIDVVCGVPDQGGGIYTVVQRVMATTLGIAPERIRVRRGSTREAPPDPGAGGSRVTHVVGQAARVAAEELAARLKSGATAPLHVKGEWDGTQHGPDHPGDYSFSAFGIQVSVDRETGAFAIHDVVLVADVGQIINPLGHQGQLDGGFITGLGSAAFEEMPLDESGKIESLSLGEYKLPTIRDIPPLRTVLVQDKGYSGPYGSKMAGELSNTGVAPALLNAIANAAGVRISELPVTSERVYDALQSR